MADERLSVATMKQGAVVEQVDEAIRQVLENTVDPNTPAKAKRSVVLKITFAPDVERELLGISASVQTKLAPAVEITGRAWVTHTRDGVVAMEHDPKQPNLYDEQQDDKVTPIEAGRGGDK